MLIASQQIQQVSESREIPRRRPQGLLQEGRRQPLLPAHPGQVLPPPPGQAGQEGRPPLQVLGQPEREDHPEEGEGPAVGPRPAQAQDQGELGGGQVHGGPGGPLPRRHLPHPQPRGQGGQGGQGPQGGQEVKSHVGKRIWGLVLSSYVCK